MDKTTKTLSSVNRNCGHFLVRLLLLVPIAALTVVWYMYLPESRASAQVSDGDSFAADEEPEFATQAMIDFALNLKSASGYSVYAERGIAEKGNTEIRGAKGDAFRGEENRKAVKALSDSISAIRQLPCIEVNSSDITGRTFAPGVYCLNTAELSGTLTIDGRGSPAGIFVFRVNGPFNVNHGSLIRVENGAQGGNVFFVASEVAIGADTTLRANILSEGDISVGKGSSISDKVLAMGRVELDNSTLLGGTTGSMKICSEQQLPVSTANDLSNRIFHFVVTGATDLGTPANPVRLSPGTCSNTFDVTAGPQTVTELNTGTLINPPTGNFEGNFELTDVTNLTPSSSSTLGLVNLATRTANVNVVAGGLPEQISLRFTNRKAITGFIEICKRAATGPGQFNPAGPNPLLGGDPDVTGFFSYTIEDVYTVNQQNPNIRILQVFTVPVGQCTGPITVTKGEPPPLGGNPNLTVASVSELPRAGAYFESTEIFPAQRRNSPDRSGQIIGVSPTGADVNISAPGGGYVSIVLTESSSSIDQTLIVFAGRSNPSRLKICKIAGPGIPLNTLFRFTVTGFGVLNAANPQAADYGPVIRTVDVRAGYPEQGGSCEFVPGFGANAPGYNQFQTFVNGTPVTVVENGLSPANTVAQNTGQLRTSQIRAFGTAFASTAVSGFSPNPDTTPTSGYVSRAAVIARSSIPEIEFSGFRFNPTVLKICNLAANTSTAGTQHTFTVALVSPQIGGANPGPMFPPFSTSLTVTAGQPGTPEGNCSFVNGSALTGGAFNQGSTVTVTQTAGTVTNIACPSCGAGGLTVDLTQKKATLTGPNGLVAGVNSVVFTNTNVVCRNGGTADQSKDSPGCTRAIRFDFDGDRKADPAIYSPSLERFSYTSSANNYQIVSRPFGVATDKIVPADYDGDGRTDYAMYRPSEGRWYLQMSAEGFTAYNWGEVGDMPQTGDYDGDGKSDLIIFRPSNATWYIRTRNDQFFIFQFGVGTDKPVLADYDGDGRTDIAVFRNGVWYLLMSSGGFTARQFGITGDVPVPGDYDGDGFADFGIYRNGLWYTLTALGFTVRSYGAVGDIPVPADYDGDGITDIAVFRPSEGKWFIRWSVLGEPIFPNIILGGPGDIPLQAP